MIGKVIRDFLPKGDLLPYIEALMRVYNAEGRRDNKYKARVKILVHETGIDDIRKAVEAEFSATHGPSIAADSAEVARIASYFASPKYEPLPDQSTALESALKSDNAFRDFVDINTFKHKQPGYVAVTVSLKPIGGAPGDATSEQMRALADAAEQFSLSELRVTHLQNIVLPYVKKDDLFALYTHLKAHDLATANIGLISDIVACPGMDYCALATARSIPIAQAIAERFADQGRQKLIGELGIKISGCINACGHHHIGHIGILGLEKSGIENYQITLGGDATEAAAIGERLGPGVNAEDVPDTIERIVDIYLEERQANERFIDTFRRVGLDRFKGAIHAVDA
jgi:sulfite reductase (NADPH) hemoprotein beta-component